jgi:tight adherence protein B
MSSGLQHGEVSGGLALLAAALICWPTRRMRMARGGVRPRARPVRPTIWAARALAVATAGGLLVAATTLAGPSGFLAAAMLLATAGVLGRRMLAQRRRRRCLPDVLRGLRALHRELRTGADPLTAVGGAVEACQGPGARVLRALQQLMRSGDGDAWLPPGEVRGADPAEHTVEFLRSGWLLSRRHGVAFGRVVSALADELTDQLAADEARRAQLAGPRMSGYVMAALPLMGLLLGAGMGVIPVAVLTGSAVGNLLLVVGVALMCGGLLWSAGIVGR